MNWPAAARRHALTPIVHSMSLPIRLDVRPFYVGSHSAAAAVATATVKAGNGESGDGVSGNGDGGNGSGDCGDGASDDGDNGNGGNLLGWCSTC